MAFDPRSKETDTTPVARYQPVYSQNTLTKVGGAVVVKGALSEDTKPRTLPDTLRPGEAISVAVERVIDGDSLVVVEHNDSGRRGPEYEVRLRGVDAPELTQRNGDQAWEYLTLRAQNKLFKLVPFHLDQYGRVIGVLYEEDLRDSLNKEMASSGLAYVVRRHSGFDPALHMAENAARNHGLGIWGEGPSGMRPWEYRAHRRALQSKRLQSDQLSSADWLRKQLRAVLLLPVRLVWAICRFVTSLVLTVFLLVLGLLKVTLAEAIGWAVALLFAYVLLTGTSGVRRLPEYLRRLYELLEAGLPWLP